MFIKLMNGELHPISEVERVFKEKGSNNTFDDFAYIKHLGRVKLFYDEYERISEGHFQTILAESGYSTLERCYEEDNSVTILSNAVLGWAVRQDGEVSPITIEGVDNGQSHWEGILTPLGTVINRSGKIHESLDDFKK